MKRSTWIAVVALAVVMIAGALIALKARAGTLAGVAVSHGADSVRAPAGVRIRVEVINTTRTRGLARRATRVLRAHGFDVVYTGTSGQIRDTTLVLDRSGHPAWVASVAQLLGAGARTEARADSSRYLDVTVLLGSSWRPPAEPLDP